MNKYPKKLMLLGSGELGKEIAIAGQKLGCNIIACDRYSNAPAMQVSDSSEVLDMNNPNQLKEIIKKHNPDFVIPEIEAIAVQALEEIEKEGIKVIPNAKATGITMNRDKIRDLACETLELKTAKYSYASNIKELEIAAKNIGFPLIIKPVMSSSGKGQSLVNNKKELNEAWGKAINEARGQSSKVIIEEFLNFDFEITLLTIRQINGETIFCPPIGHEQYKGDYQCSWQPVNMADEQLIKARKMAKLVTDALGGSGLFGVEFFISGNEVIFSELSPRPHDTGLVTLISQNLNEFELHLRAILNIPIPEIMVNMPAASRVILADKEILNVGYNGLETALSEKKTNILMFGKQTAKKGRRMGVALALGNSIKSARYKADQAAKCIKIIENKII